MIWKSGDEVEWGKGRQRTGKDEGNGKRKIGTENRKCRAREGKRRNNDRKVMWGMREDGK